jgi:hypothetical protein
MEVRDRVRQVAAATAPQNPRRDLVEVQCRFALTLFNVTGF